MVAFALGCGFAQGAHAHQVPCPMSLTHCLRTFQTRSPSTSSGPCRASGLPRRSQLQCVSLMPFEREKTLIVLTLIASSARHPRADVPAVAHALHRVRDVRSGRARRRSDRQRDWGRPDPAHGVRLRPILARSLRSHHIIVAHSETWRSTFWFLAGLSALCAIGGFFSIDPDIPYALADK